MTPSLQLKMQIKPSIQLIMAGRYLRATCDELNELLCQEITANPLLLLPRNEPPSSSFKEVFPLDEGDSRQAWSEWTDYATKWGDETMESFEYFASCESVHDQLAKQIRLISTGPPCEAAINLLPYLDEHGFLAVDDVSLMADLGFNNEQIRAARSVLYDLEPPGIGASDIRHCLLLQCSQLEKEGHPCNLAHELLDIAWDDFLHQRWDRLAKKNGKSRRQIQQAVDFLRSHCYLYPISLLDAPSDPCLLISKPDLILRRNNNKYFLEIPEEENWSLQINREYLSYLDSSQDRETLLSADDLNWLRRNLDRAHLIINALKQRWKTLRQVGEYLILPQASSLCADRQAQLVPITRRELAQNIGLSESTICRAIKNKILQLPNGQLMLLSDLFDRSQPVKACMTEIYSELGNAVSDQEISQRLQAFGFNVARRTVAKYRNQMVLPNAHQCKQPSFG